MSTSVDVSNVVDLYNSATGAWSTAQLSAARVAFAATSLGSLAIFAGGGGSGSVSECLMDFANVLNILMCIIIMRLFALRLLSDAFYPS